MLHVEHSEALAVAASSVETVVVVYDMFCDEIQCSYHCMTVSTGDATPPKSSTSTNSISLVQIQIDPQSEFDFVLRDTEKFEFLNFWDFGDVAFSVETVIGFSHIYTAD